MPRAPGQLTRPGSYRRVHRPGFAYPQVYGSYYYSPVFGHGYGYNPYYYGYPRAYGSYFYFGGYPYTVGYGYPWIYDSAWGYGQTPFYGGYAADYPDYYQGSLRLKIKPRDAEVYVDDYYVGVVDSFDGVFQRLRLEGGTAPHRDPPSRTQVDRARSVDRGQRDGQLGGADAAELAGLPAALKGGGRRCSSNR